MKDTIKIAFLISSLLMSLCALAQSDSDSEPRFRAGNRSMRSNVPPAPVIPKLSPPIPDKPLVVAPATAVQVMPVPVTPLGAIDSPATDPYIVNGDDQTVLMGRYSTTSGQPPLDLIEPMNAMVSLSFPRQSVQTLRQAIDYSLLRSGYRFVDSALDEQARAFLELPLPESQREIGPYSLYNVLRVLAGSAWQPMVSRPNRTVWIRLKTANDEQPGAIEPQSASQEGRNAGAPRESSPPRASSPAPNTSPTPPSVGAL